MSKQLKQVINLSKKTGDRIIVFDNNFPDDSFVVMTLDQYEKLMGDHFQPKNQSQNDNFQDLNTNAQKIIDDNAQVLTEKKIIDKIEDRENNDNDNLPNRNFKNNNWQIPAQVKQESEE
ncbi:MAG: hypothetical protein PHP37_01560 [Patescibacteria group bacterium]|nr:hypothetical protein [Patescibacteria group bacterium]